MNFAASFDSATGLADAWLLDAVLPRGGYLLALAEAYFDESGSHSGSQILCVAGYILSKRGARLLGIDWCKMLKRYRLTYFHMVDCAHGSGEFANLTMEERIAVEKEAIALIKLHTYRGLAVTVNEEEFKRHVPPHPYIGSPYSFCSHVILAGVAVWLGQRPDVKRCAYFFEAGHSSQSEANRIMTMLFNDREMATVNRYASHAFVRKEESASVQAADLLAWQWYTDKKRKLQGNRRRRDCASLFEHPHEALHISEDRIVDLMRRFGDREPTPRDLVAIHLGDPE